MDQLLENRDRLRSFALEIQGMGQQMRRPGRKPLAIMIIRSPPPTASFSSVRPRRRASQTSAGAFAGRSATRPPPWSDRRAEQARAEQHRGDRRQVPAGRRSGQVTECRRRPRYVAFDQCRTEPAPQSSGSAARATVPRCGRSRSVTQISSQARPVVQGHRDRHGRSGRPPRDGPPVSSGVPFPGSSPAPRNVAA